MSVVGFILGTAVAKADELQKNKDSDGKTIINK